MQSSDKKLYQYTREKDKSSCRLARALTIEAKIYGYFFFSWKQKVWFQNRRSKYRKQEKQLQKALSPVLSPCNAMIRNFYQTSTGRPYQYGTTTNGTNNIVSNQIRYPSTNVGYPQFSPLTAAGIRQVR